MELTKLEQLVLTRALEVELGKPMPEAAREAALIQRAAMIRLYVKLSCEADRRKRSAIRTQGLSETCQKLHQELSRREGDGSRSELKELLRELYRQVANS